MEKSQKYFWKYRIDLDGVKHQVELTDNLKEIVNFRERVAARGSNIPSL
jgi:hypothetical protein